MNEKKFNELEKIGNSYNKKLSQNEKVKYDKLIDNYLNWENFNKKQHTFKHKKRKVTKTKQLAIENWKKFLNAEYYNKHFKELSKSQQRKVKQYLKDDKKVTKR
jgi:hypothetical protein